jgi:hypothetical protein
MQPESLPQRDEEFLSEVFELAVRSQATGSPLELDALLAGRGHLRKQALETIDLARDVAVVGTPAPVSRAIPRAPGFTIVEEIGRGSSGIVYRARQERLGRTVALKLLSPALLASRRGRDRFVIEAQALGRVRHPNVVTIHEVLDGDLCGYAMEWVDGATLAKAIDSRDPLLDVAGVARLGVAIARALAAVHAAGLIHRDVKPGNVLLRTDGTPLLADFSLARELDHGLHTATGEFVGTAAYAAPEQLRGDHASVGPWTDVYGLGATLYAALTGTTPFGTSSTPEMMRRIEGGLRTPIRRLNPKVPVDFCTIVGKAMDPDQRRRYRTAAELADDLERFLRFEPIHARRAGITTRIARLARRNRVAFISATSAALVAIALATALAIEWNRRLKIPARFSEELRLARSCLLDRSLNHRFFIAMNIPGTEAVGLTLPPPAVFERALEHYGRAMALVPDDQTARLEAAVVSVAQALVRHEKTLPEAAERLRAPCPLTFDVGSAWLAAGAFSEVDESRIGSASEDDRRCLGLLASLCTRVPLSVRAWSALEAKPDFDDALVAGSLGEMWLVLDRPALAVPRLARARREFPESGFLALDLADSLVRTGDTVRAEAMLEVARRLDSEGLDVRRVEADLLAARGRREEAYARYTADELGPTGRFHLARFLAEQGDVERAFSVLGQLCIPFPAISRYRELLVQLLEPAWDALSIDEQAGVVAEATAGRHHAAPMYAIGAVLQDRGLLRERPRRGPRPDARPRGVPLRSLILTPRGMGLASVCALRARPAGTLALARKALAVDAIAAWSGESGLATAIANVVAWVAGAPERRKKEWLWDADGRPNPKGPRGPRPIAVVAAGDLDRDGCDDVLAGDPDAHGGRGVCRVLAGRSGKVLREIVGDEGVGLGRSFSRAGDVDRDGASDLLIGGHGRVLVVSGADGKLIRVLSGGDVGDDFGSAVGAAGDLDSDGCPDAWVGTATGALAFSGATGALLRTVAGAPALARSLDAGADVDGDGVPDVLVGSPFSSAPGLKRNGRATLYSGATGRVLWTDEGTTAYQTLGASVAFVGDVNGDGAVDWAVGAIDEPVAWDPGPGCIRIHAGPEGRFLRTIGGLGPDCDGFGAAVSSAGDLDGDALPELVVQAEPRHPGWGSTHSQVYSPGAGFALLRHVPAALVVGGLDVDGDRRPDLVAGRRDPPGFVRLPAIK